MRIALARRLAALAPGLSASEQTRLQAQAIETLSGLVADESVRIRAAIADVVKDMPDAPRALILRLARDLETPVFEPIIRLSPILSPEDLLALISERADPSVALAVARRPGLSAAVADAVVATADTAAIGALLANPSAAIREETLDALIARAHAHVDWHAPLVRRPRLSERAARALAELVADHLLAELAARADLGAELAAELRRRLASRLTGSDRVAACGPSNAEMLSQAQALAAEGGLTEAALARAVHQGDVRFAAALLAVAADVPLAVVERCAALRSAKGMISLVWKAGFTMRIALPLQMLLGRLAPREVLQAGAGGGFPLAIEELRWQIELLSRARR
jgi:uncharacterized protein (DUF2336 family)